MKSRKERRKTILKKLKHDIAKDKANPDRISKWLMVMESKKRLFALEDEIDKLMSELKKEK
jgi:uncharacterized small protein (DUF1192 family)